MGARRLVILALKKWKKPSADVYIPISRAMKIGITLLSLSLVAAAEDFTLADGTVLKEAEVLRKSSDEIQIRHAGGIEKFSYRELSSDLQQRFDLTPESVHARKQEALDAEAEKQRAREQALADKQRAMREAQEAKLAALEAAGKYARYLSGADVIQLCSGMLTIEARAAEFLAAEWNRREALRLNLGVDQQRFTADVDALRADFEKERKALVSLRSELEQKRARVKEQAAAIKRQNEEIAQLRAQIAKLNKELGRAEAESIPSSSGGTVVIDRPVYVPTYIAPVSRPRPCPPRPRPAKPAVHRPRPIQVSPGPRPAGSAHTLPRK